MSVYDVALETLSGEPASLVDRRGEPVRRFRPRSEPGSPEVVGAIEGLLAG